MAKVIVYSKPKCTKCKMLKMWLKMKEIEFEEIDIIENVDGYNKIVDANRRNLPVLEINESFVDYTDYNEILKYI